jgi:hypothetical protein
VLAVALNFVLLLGVILWLEMPHDPSHLLLCAQRGITEEKPKGQKETRDEQNSHSTDKIIPRKIKTPLSFGCRLTSWGDIG